MSIEGKIGPRFYFRIIEGAGDPSSYEDPDENDETLPVDLRPAGLEEGDRDLLVEPNPADGD